MAPKSPRTNSRRLSRAVRIGSSSLRMGCFSGSPASYQHLAWIHDAFGIQGPLYGVHDRQLDRIRSARQFRRLQAADAVLRADASAEAVDQIEHRRFQDLRTRQEGGTGGVRALAHIEMQIAVSGMPVAHHVTFGREAPRQLR